MNWTDLLVISVDAVVQWLLAVVVFKVGRTVGYRLGSADARVTQLHCACGWTSGTGTASEVLGETMGHIGDTHE